MNVMHASTDVLNAAARHRRYGRIEILFVGCFCVLLVLASFIAVIAIDRQREIEISTQDIECLLRLDAEYSHAQAETLALVPGTPERTAAAERMKRVADNFRNGCLD